MEEFPGVPLRPKMVVSPEKNTTYIFANWVIIYITDPTY